MTIKAPKTFLVTGSSSGLGKNIADGLAGSGGRVIYHSRVHHDIDLPSGADYCVADLSNTDEAVGLVNKIEKTNPIDCLVCCAGRTTLHPKEDNCLNFIKSDALKVFNNILFCTTNVCQPVATEMIKRNRGKIIIIGGDVVDKPNIRGDMCTYAMAKAAVHQYGLYLAQQLRAASAFISVNVVAPTGIIRENTITEVGRLNRRALADEVSEVVRQLCNSEHSFLTGQIIRVNGGRVTY
jgi:NAD(P)-dependent dehydrogenase (short-subunit alcohol dehydrogenase family)